MEHVHTEKVGALDVVIDYDNDPLNPRAEFDHVGTMVCAHSRYTLGDVQVNNVDEVLDYILQEDGVWVSDGAGHKVEWNGYNWEWEDDQSEWQPAVGKLSVRGAAILPLFLYDHSGISMSCSEFFDPWDSGQVGIIYISDKRIAEEWDGDREAAVRCLKAEVSEYDAYLTGQVYRYEILGVRGEVLESCGGFYSEDDCKEEAISTANFMVNEPKHISYLIREALEDLKNSYRAAMSRQIGSESVEKIEAEVDNYLATYGEEK